MSKEEENLSVHPVATINGKERFSFASFSNDGHSIITQSRTGCERWCAETGVYKGGVEAVEDDYLSEAEFYKRHLPDQHPKTKPEIMAHAMFASGLNCFATSPDGKLAAIGSFDGGINILDASSDEHIRLTGHPTNIHHMHPNNIAQMLFDSSSTLLASMAEEDDAPLLWDLTAPGKVVLSSGIPIKVLDNPIHLNQCTPAGIDTIDFSPVETKFVSTHRTNSSAEVWKIVREFPSLTKKPAMP